MGPHMEDNKLFYDFGIDPVTKKPIRIEDKNDAGLKENIKICLRILDEQNALQRYRWYNLPDGLETIIERVLYYRGQGMFFYLEETKSFYFLPYIMANKDKVYGIDIYGRFTAVKPLPFYGSSEIKSDNEQRFNNRFKYLMNMEFIPQYDLILEKIEDPKFFTTSCVLLSDYSKQRSQTIIPRQQLNDPLLDVMANCIPYMNTSLQINTGVSGMRVNNQDESSNVQNANRSLKKAALIGEPYIPIEGAVEFQQLKENSPATAQEFMSALESLDNFRLGLYGITNGGIFAKKAHMLQEEQDLAGGAVGLVYEDGLSIRQRFCSIVNSIWGLGIGCEPAEPEIGDINMDGFNVDEDDQYTDSEPAQSGGGEEDVQD